MSTTYVLDKATLVDANHALQGSRIRLGRAAFVIIGAVAALVLGFGLGSLATMALLILSVGAVLGIRYGTQTTIGRSLDRVTDGVGEMSVTLTIRPDGLQIDDGFAVSVVGWRYLRDSKRSDDFLLLAAPGRGGIVAPRAELSPQFEANLDRMLRGSGIEAEPASPTVSPVLRSLQGVLIAALLFLVLCVVIVIAAGGPNRDRVGTCPDGQIAIVTRDSDGRIATLCQYRLDG